MNDSEDNLKRTHEAMDRYFLAEYNRKLLKLGYRVPSIGDYNRALAIKQRTDNEHEFKICSIVMFSYRHGCPLHPRILEKLGMLSDKHDIKRIKLTNYGKETSS